MKFNLKNMLLQYLELTRLCYDLQSFKKILPFSELLKKNSGFKMAAAKRIYTGHDKYEFTGFYNANN